MFHYPQANDRDFLKRVIGVPGDTIEEWGGAVWVSGAPLTSVETQAEPVREATTPDMPPVRVPAGQYFVLGDNATASLDSRVWGPVSIREVVGKALFICWSHGAHWWDIRWDRIGRRLF